jgi:hypothetical protein
VEVEEPHDPALGEREREGFEFVELAGGVAAAHHRADRAARDDVGDDPGLREHAQHADMRPAAGGAAAERQADPQPRARILLYRSMHDGVSRAASAHSGATPGDAVPKHEDLTSRKRLHEPVKGT